MVAENHPAPSHSRLVLIQASLLVLKARDLRPVPDVLCFPMSAFMLYALYGLSAVSLLFSIGGLLVAGFASKFEGGAGIGGSFLFLVGAACSGVVAILLYKNWSELERWPKLVGGVSCLPLVTVIIVVFYVLVVSE